MPEEQDEESWRLRCTYGPIGKLETGDQHRRGRAEVIQGQVPERLLRVALTKSWRTYSGLDEILVSGADPEAVLEVRVLPARSGGGGGGGGGGGPAETRTFERPTGTVTVGGLTRTGRILYPQAIISPQAAADEYCKRVDANGQYTMTGTSSYRKAIAFEPEAGGSEQAVGLLLWELVLEPLEVFERITCSA